MTKKKNHENINDLRRSNLKLICHFDLLRKNDFNFYVNETISSFLQPQLM